MALFGHIRVISHEDISWATPQMGGLAMALLQLSCEANSFNAAVKGERNLGLLSLLTLPPPFRSFQIRGVGPVSTILRKNDLKQSG